MTELFCFLFFLTTLNAMYSLCPSPGSEMKAAWASSGLPPPPATHLNPASLCTFYEEQGQLILSFYLLLHSANTDCISTVC